MRKLSPTQREVLELLAAGERLEALSDARHIVQYLIQDYLHVRSSTFFVLRTRRWIERHSTERFTASRIVTWVISPAGRKALEVQDGPDE